MIDKIKLRLKSMGIVVEEQDDVLALIYEDARQAILNYTHRKQFPEELEHLAREMVVAAVAADESGGVSSIKRGDTQINYNAAITAADFTEKQKAELNGFRIFRTR